MTRYGVQEVVNLAVRAEPSPGLVRLLLEAIHSQTGIAPEAEALPINRTPRLYARLGSANARAREHA